MRKSIWTVLFAAAVALLAAGCAKESDVKNLQGQIDNLGDRVTALEKAVKEINENTVPSLQNLVNALEKKLTVTSIIEGSGQYTITFSDGTTATIKDGAKGDKGDTGAQGEQGVQGEKGEQGDAGTQPEVSIALDEDGIYYWTVNGQWLLDGDGNKVPVTAKGDKGDKGDQGEAGAQGEKGEDGVTPLFGTNQDHKLIVSYDNGQTWVPIGLSVIDGSAFTSAYIDDEKSTDDYIVLVVGETEVQIPKEKAFALKFNYEGDTSAVGANAGDNISIAYEVEGASEGDEITVDVLATTAGLTASIVKVDATTGYVLITVPAADEENPTAVSGKVFAFADNNKGKTNIKVITLEEGVIESVADVDAQVTSAGGEIELTVTTNKEYNVNINDEATAWLSVVPDTRATHTDKLLIKVEANATGAYRVGVVSVNDRANGDLINAYTVVQQPAADVATDIASLRLLADGTQVAANSAVVVASSKEGALVVDENSAYIYVKFDGNTAVRGDIVSFSGAKKTTEDTKVIYVEATALEVTAQAEEVKDLPWQYIGYGEKVNSINTGSTGLLQKDQESGKYFFASPQIPCVYVADPINVNLADFEGKYVTVKGYTNGAFVELDEEYNLAESSYYNIIATSVEEVNFEVNPNWTLSYEGEFSQYGYTFSEILNTVSAGEDYYANGLGIATVYPIEGSLEQVDIVALARKEALKIADDVQYYFSMYSKSIDDEAINQSGSFSAVAPTEYGSYLVFASGLTEEGYASGKFAYVVFEKENPYKKAAYDDFLGDWTLDGAKWTISENVPGVSYNVTAPILGLDTVVLDGLFVDGTFAFMEKNLGAMGDYQNVSLSANAYTNTGDHYGLNVNYTEPQPIFTVSVLKEDNSMVITPGKITISENTFNFNYMELLALSGEEYTSLSYVPTPKSMVKYVPPVSADYEDFLGEWVVPTTTGSSTWVITQNEKDATYNITGINAQDVDGGGQPLVVVGEYTAEGTMTISVQVVSKAPYTYNNTENVVDYMSALNGNNKVTTTQGTVLCTGTIEDGKLVLSPGTFGGSEVATLVFLRSSMNLLGSNQTPLPVVVDHPQEASDAYKKWLGSWEVSEGDYTRNGSYTITEIIADQSLAMGPFYPGIATSIAILDFDKESGNMLLKFKATGNSVSSGSTTYNLYNSGITNTGNVSMGDPNKDNLIATFVMSEDGQSAYVDPAVYDNNGEETYATQIGLFGYASGSGWGNFGMFIKSGITITKTAEAGSTSVKSFSTSIPGGNNVNGPSVAAMSMQRIAPKVQGSSVQAVKTLTAREFKAAFGK
ncbi:MAG: hypothetical protein IJ627_00265 [Bacteroidales bacterium]|nr:hypothetical protein [Bacteroidales bacterium]